MPEEGRATPNAIGPLHRQTADADGTAFSSGMAAVLFGLQPHKVTCSSAGSDGEEGWEGWTCWGPQGRPSRNDYICIPSSLLPHPTPPARVGIQGGEALQASASPGVWGRVPVRSLITVLKSFKPGRAPPSQQMWDYDKLAEAKMSVGERRGFFKA